VSESAILTEIIQIYPPQKQGFLPLRNNYPAENVRKYLRIGVDNILCFSMTYFGVSILDMLSVFEICNLSTPGK